MSDFDKAEWKLDNNVVSGKTWSPIDSRPRRDFCDIRLKDGTEIGPCWPRDNDFIDLSSDDDQSYPYSSVTDLRYYVLDERLDDEDYDSDGDE